MSVGMRAYVLSTVIRGGIHGPGRSEKPRLLEQVRRRLRVGHYSLRTERAYLGWIRRFILANGKRHPRELGAVEVETYLTLLPTRGQVYEP